MRINKRWLMVVLFAMAMAWVESACVVYLRTLIGRIDPWQVQPLPHSANFGTTEVTREAATLVMLAAVGWLAGATLRLRLAYTLLAFGVWDIFYYVFLKIICGWPRTLLDWDVLFLIPLPWWGPVLAPMLIAALMAAWGTLVVAGASQGQPPRSSWRVWTLAAAGATLALGVFMADALRVAGDGPEAVRHVLPAGFDWPLFGVAWLAMAAPVAGAARQWRGRARP